MGPPLTALGRRAREAQDRALAGARSPTTGEVLLGRLARRRRSARLGAIAAAIGAMVIVLGAGFALRPRPLSFALAEGRAGREGEWISAGDARDVALRFSDGSRFALAPASQARVAAIAPDGARVVLERGAVEAAVVHRPHGAWDLDAGPFTVHVTGTRFHLTWTPEAERLDLALIEGSVRVTGPLLEGGRAVVAGETLEVRVKEHRLEVRRAGDQAALPVPPLGPPPIGSSPPPIGSPPPLIAVASAPEVAPSSPASASPPSLDIARARAADITPAPPARTAAPPAPSLSAQPTAALSAQPTTALSAAPSARAVPTAPSSWRELAVAGRYRDALARAEAEGFDALCESGSAADLLALGDAARFAGDASRARRAYLSLRRRFPGDRDAAVAAFILGRLAFDRDAAFTQAARWLSTYLAEAPSGSYARDASGRLVEALHRSGDLAAARAAALRYLDAYPGGPHAELARSVAGPGDDGGASGPRPRTGGTGP